MPRAAATPMISSRMTPGYCPLMVRINCAVLRKAPMVEPAQAKMPASEDDQHQVRRRSSRSPPAPGRCRDKPMVRYSAVTDEQPVRNTATTAVSVGVKRPLRKPPRMINRRQSIPEWPARGPARRPGDPGFHRRPKSCLRERISVGIAMDRPTRRPGIRPAAKSARRSVPGTSTE